jgi:hypothetical protein
MTLAMRWHSVPAISLFRGMQAPTHMRRPASEERGQLGVQGAGSVGAGTCALYTHGQTAGSGGARTCALCTRGQTAGSGGQGAGHYRDFQWCRAQERRSHGLFGREMFSLATNKNRPPGNDGHTAFLCHRTRKPTSHCRCECASIFFLLLHVFL